MPEPANNPNPRFLVDPPSILRLVIRKMFDRVINPSRVNARRERVEAKRKNAGLPHVVEYFHQFDDPYSHLTTQVLAKLKSRYNIEIVIHFIHPTGGKLQPEAEKLAHWARRDAELIAPHYDLEFPENAPLRPTEELQERALNAVAGLSVDEIIDTLAAINSAIWSGNDPLEAQTSTSKSNTEILDAGSARLRELVHYSGAMFYYGGEWYWGVDRLLHLEQRLRELGTCHDASQPLICPRPEIDLSNTDATGVELDFYASLNSPYTSIIFDTTIKTAKSCNAKLNFKPVLPMLMRGLPVPKTKGMYLLFDTKREAQLLGVPFGPVTLPVGQPVRDIYSLLPWASEQGKDLELMSTALNLAFTKGVGLHRTSGLRRAVEEAGLSWTDAKKRLGDTAWQPIVSGYQDEMDNELGLWGVPCYRLHGSETDDELCVWGQDRLWLVAAEIKRRVQKCTQGKSKKA